LQQQIKAGELSRAYFQFDSIHSEINLFAENKTIQTRDRRDWNERMITYKFASEIKIFTENGVHLIAKELPMKSKIIRCR